MGTDEDADLARLRAGRPSAVARVVDETLHPFVVGGAGVVVTAIDGGARVSPATLLGAIAVVAVAVGGPWAILRHSLRTGRLTDRQAVRRAERWRPLALGGLCLLAAAGVAVALGLPASALFLGRGVLATGVAALLTRFVTKVSLHTTAAAGFAVTVGRYAPAWGVAPGLVTVAALCWGRLRQGRHTLGQLLLGAGVGTTMFVVA